MHSTSDQVGPVTYTAGLLMYRRHGRDIQVFLVHTGGPAWASIDHEAWTMPKGEYDQPESPLDAAKREFREETGFDPHSPFLPLGSGLQQSGKLMTAYAFEGDCDPSLLRSNTCTIEWPPQSGSHLEIPEVDKGEWFSIGSARHYIRPGQIQFLDLLLKLISPETR